MELLPLHIEYLLTRHDCVIVPGFGAFIVTETEARFDMENGIIHPRKREIGFNSSIVSDDHLLSHSIARRERISHEEAHRLLMKHIDKMRSDLRKEGEVSLGMIGSIRMDSEGFLTFVPRRAASYSDIFQDIKITKIEDIRNTEEAPENATDDVNTDSYVDEQGMRTIKVAADRYVFTVSKRAVHALAMLIAVFTIGLSILIPFNHDNEQKASVISFENIFNPNKAENVVNDRDTVGLPTPAVVKNNKDGDIIKKNE
ncbi:MAG: hypothetical protein K2G85_02160 [Muribaculaceae bacterium]|nr:hypothetical protein [Muribaculaceae bacterium]